MKTNPGRIAAVFCTLPVAMLAPINAGAQASDYELDLEAGVSATDNINRASNTPTDPDFDETIYTAGLSFLFNQDSSRWDANVRGSVLHYSYENQTFEDETLSTVTGYASAYFVEDILDWYLSVDHGQQIGNPFQPVTPDNREDVTIVATGPNFSLPMGSRNYLTGGASYTDVRYETRPFDNSRIGGRLGLQRDIRRETSASLNISGDRIEYDIDFLSPPIERYNAYFGYDVSGPRNNFSLSLGWNQVESAGNEGDGLLLELDWQRQLTPELTMTLNMGTNYSADGDIFRLNNRLDEGNRGTQDVQGVSDAFRHDYVRLGYTKAGQRTRVGVTASFDKESYENSTALDRDVFRLALNLSRDFTRTLDGRLFASIGGRDYTDPAIARNDDDTTYGVGFGWKFGTKTSLRLRVDWIERDSGNVLSDYEELRGSLTFHYTPIKSR